MKAYDLSSYTPKSDYHPRISTGDIDIEVLANGEWHNVTLTDTGFDHKTGYWFTARGFSPKFWIADRGITWRKRFLKG